jgi:hypothetical protein
LAFKEASDITAAVLISLDGKQIRLHLFKNCTNKDLNQILN